MAERASWSQPGFKPGALSRQPAHHLWLWRVSAALMLPREHGAWAMLLMPYLVGTVVAGGFGQESFLLLVSVLLLFMSSRPLEVLLQSRPATDADHGGRAEAADPGADASRAAWKTAAEQRRQASFRLAVYLWFGVALGVLVASRRWALLPLGALASALLVARPALRRRYLDRSWPARLTSIAALAIAGPAAYYAASGLLDRRAFAVWALGFFYSGGSLFYVRLFNHPTGKRMSSSRSDGQARAKRQLLAYLAVCFACLAGLSALGWLPMAGMMALVPMAVKSAWALARPGHRPTLRRIGYGEIVHTVLFGVLAALVLAA